MRSYLALFAVSALASAVLTPIVRILAIRLGAVSRPGGRNVNERAVPRFGGIAICLSFFTALGALYASEAAAAAVIRDQVPRLAALVVGGVGLCVVGLVDDARRVRALYKLYAQIAAAIVAYACGFRIEAVQLPLLGSLSMGVFAAPVTVFWIVGITNAINLIDGLDGLAAGVVFFAAITNLVVAQLTGATFVAISMSAMLGAVLGFLVFNFNPARIFMGDSGSYFLGFLLGTMSLAGASVKTSTAVSLLVPVVALGLPIVDTLLSIVRRFLERRPLFAPDRGHIHHRLLDMGITHRRAVLIMYGLCVVLTTAAIGVALGRTWAAGLALVAASVVVIGVVRFVGYSDYLLVIRRQKARLRSADAERLRGLLPDVPGLFATANTEDDVWEALCTVLDKAGLCGAELVRAGGGPEVARWTRAAVSSSVDASEVSARYPLGPDALARAELRFRWLSDAGDVSPHTEVLLQVVVDVIAKSLNRVGSAHAPAVSAPAASQALQSEGLPHPRPAF